MRSEIGEAFARFARDHANCRVLFGMSEGVVRTASEIAAEAAALGAALDALPLPPAPCLLSVVGNRTAFVPLLLASLARGAVLVLLDGDASDAEVDATASRLGVDAVIGRDGATAFHAAAGRPLASGLAVRLRPRTGSGWSAPTGGPLIVRVTSGSTSRPKAVVLTETQLVADGRHIIEAMDIRPDDVGLGVIPISHAYGTGNLLLPLVLQGTRLVLRDGFSAGSLAADVADHGVSMLPAVPFIYDYLRRHGTAAALAAVRLLVTAGAPIDFETVAYFRDAVGRTIHSLYGASEVGSIAFDAADEVESPPSVGRPMPGTTVTLVPAEGAAPGQGRVHVRGEAVALGYAAAGGDEAPSAFCDGGFLTGDLGRFDARGRLFLTGRISPFVNVAGRKVQPDEVERVIRQVDGVLEVLVVGVPDPARGQMLAACVRRQRPGVTAEAIRAVCAERLSPYKVPRRIVFPDDWPVDARGKVDRDAVVDLVTRILQADRA